MKIAQIAPPWISVPPKGYGGIEWVVQQLCDGLVAAGHDVTLYATGDSRTSASLRALFPLQMPEKMHTTALEARHVSFAVQNSAEFDVIHDHSGFLLVAFYRYLQMPPLLHTVHCAFNELAYPLYEQFAQDLAYCSISKYQQVLAPPGMRWVGNVYNAVDFRTWPFRPVKDDYLLAFGRICEDKGFHVAIEVARRTGLRLLMAGAVQEAYRSYYEERIVPELDDQIIYLGELEDQHKRDLFAGAKAFLMPILWPEPFGLVMIEALVCGTPVIAFRNGAVSEVVDHGQTGFIVDDVDEMVTALKRLNEIDATNCRRVVEERFSVERMVDDYLALYRRVLAEAP